MAIEDIGKNALQVLEKRYLAKDAEGNHTEDVAGLFRRVAAAVAAADRNYDENADTAALADSFYELMTSGQTGFFFTAISAPQGRGFASAEARFPLHQ